MPRTSSTRCAKTEPVAAMTSPTWAAWAGRVPALLAVGAGLCLLGMVCVVTLGVVLRYVFGAPLLGVNEIVQLIAVALVMLALPYCTASGAHVRVDLFDRVLGRAGRLAGDLLGRGLSIMALAVICRQAWRKAAEAMEFGDATNMLGLPLWPFYGAILAGMGLCALVYLVQVAALLAGHDLDGPDTPEAPTAPEAGTAPETGVPAAEAHAFHDTPDATPAAPGRPAPADPKAPNTPTGKEQTR